MRSRSCLGLLAIFALLAQSSCAAPAEDDPAGEGRMVIPMTQADGSTRMLAARLCRPAGASPARLVTINHGSPPQAEARPGMRLGRCDTEVTQWFTGRGYAVLYVMRRGYGATGGAYAESGGPCSRIDYHGAGVETARDMTAAVDFATALPGIRPDGAVVVGQSAGGWGAVAFNAQPHPKVAAFVSMAGGRGGHIDGVPNRNCRPDLLAEVAGRFGAAATTPMLWVYAANDSFFDPSIAAALYQAFTKAGGRAELVQPGPFGRDGHQLLFGRGGPAVWGPLMERYLARQGAV